MLEQIKQMIREGKDDREIVYSFIKDYAGVQLYLLIRDIRKSMVSSDIANRVAFGV